MKFVPKQQRGSASPYRAIVNALRSFPLYLALAALLFPLALGIAYDSSDWLAGLVFFGVPTFLTYVICGWTFGFYTRMFIAPVVWAGLSGGLLFLMGSDQVFQASHQPRMS